MNEKIVNKLNELLIEDNTIYVLKGFNFIDASNIKLEHIFNLNLYSDLDNINNVDNKNFMGDNLGLLMQNKSFYCYYEEIYYWEMCNLYGIIENCNKNIKLIDIGCFEMYYPGFINAKNNSIIQIFNEDSTNKNIYQMIYSQLDSIENIPFICYNKSDHEDKWDFERLFNRFTDEYSNYTNDSIKEIEMLDNCNASRLVNIFYNFLNKNVNTIKFVIIENKKDTILKRFLSVLNEMGCNIKKEKEEKKLEVSEYYEEYRKILKRKNNEYEFREFDIYKNPFESNEIIKINQCVIIDDIYKNIIKAQRGDNFRDIFVTAPTGAGKSLLFQVPAILSAEKNNLITLVISPLIGLMNDQVENIKVMTSSAVTINSDYTPFEKEEIKKGLQDGRYSILYISPETLLSNYDIKSIVGERKIGLMVIDEAHTVATWGKNFRPDYWYLGEYLNRLRHTMNYTFPIAAFTATATISNGIDDMYHDIVESLNMVCEPYIGNVKREEIHFDIIHRKKEKAYKEEKEKVVVEKIEQLINSNERSLVYFPYVKILREMFEKNLSNKVSQYYGGLDKVIKNQTLEDLRSGKRNVALATKAFGMGIDVDHILNVYHFAPTGNLADYVQEIGRAARKKGEIGVASTDFFEEDFKYIKQLHGLSQITDYHIKGVLSKILFKYSMEKKRNFLISCEDFAHVFNAKDDDGVESNLKATIIAIKRDFKYLEHNVPLIFKPRSMYTKGMFYIADSQFMKIKEFGWEKYLELKYPGESLSKMSHDECKTTYYGNVYEFDFKKCWEENYNDFEHGITFGNFKRLFYENNLPDKKDRSFMKEKMVLKIESKRKERFSDLEKRILVKLDNIKRLFDAMKQSNKHQNLNEIVDMYVKIDGMMDKTHFKGIVDPLINLLINFNTKTMGDTFCDYNQKTQRYCVKSTFYVRKIEILKKAIKNYFLDFQDAYERVSIVGGEKNVSRQDPVVIAVQIMEMYDMISYNFQAGNKPEFFVRVNSETALRRIVENDFYHSKTLEAISELHYSSIRYMKHFFTVLDNDKDRWQFIEDYFLGNVERKWSVPEEKKEKEVTSIHETQKELLDIYLIYDYEDKRTYSYYIKEENIKSLNEDIYVNIKPDTELAKKIKSVEVGQEFNINEYKYKIERIDHIEI